jgi:diadenosine tetraphosphate (Ap4A) HIT family hydrolase
MKMNWLHLGNGVPHLHVHLVPRPPGDARGGGPLEDAAFNQAETAELEGVQMEREVAALRAALGT